jgi:hypothetical protein
MEKVTKSLGGIFRTLERVGSPLQRLKSSLRTVSVIPRAIGRCWSRRSRGALGEKSNGQYERHRTAVTKEMM